MPPPEHCGSCLRIRTDPQVSYASLSESLVPVSGDSDLLAYGISEEPGNGKLIVVKTFKHEWFRIIDLSAETEAGQYPLFDLYKNHGRIVFQLYAACTGCDFTENRCGISGIGYETFISAASDLDEFTPATLAESLWDNEEEKMVAAGLDSQVTVEGHAI
mmetsp:Transcript_25373/g.43316  ORF Transcript_25373/g.43316 Transcript_25373/m.43316 type:complete len:160 (-) Transcript_25373:136-615(-)